VSLNERDLGSVLLDQLAQVIGAVAGGEAVATPFEGQTGTQWTATLAAEGVVRAACVLSFDDAGAAALATSVAGQSDETAIEGVLRDVVTQAVAGVLAMEESAGLQLTLRNVSLAESAPSDTAIEATSVAVPGLASPIRIAYFAVLAPPVTRRAEKRSSAHDHQQARLDVILDIDLPVVVRFGRTEMPLKAVTRITPGAVIDLGRSPDDPVELLVSDRVIARGEVVVVGGNYGIRIVDVVSPSERMRSMEA
jgi:flagellar motor switch protein FliN/FliY